MSRFTPRSAAVLLVLLLLPASASAQFAGAITGVAKDASGGVLPGVTVEAASPALIEKVRSVVTDDTGQYRIVDLRPGTYSVTFTLPGFSTVKREGIEITGTFVATVNGDLKVGALEETITVTGETPVVDVQSVKVQQTVSNDIIRAIPSSRSAGGIQALIPGMSSNGDSGGITGGGGSAGSIHGGKGSDSRTYSDGLNIGWAGGGGGQWGNMVNVAAAQELVLSTSGGLGEAETAGVTLNAIPREGGNTFSGSIVANGASGAWQGSNYTQSLKDQGLKAPSELNSLYEINPMGGGRIIRDKLWFYTSYRHIATDNTVPGMFVNRNAGNPNSWAVDFDQRQQAFNETLDRILTGRVTWQATPRNKLNFSWQEQIYHRNWKGGGAATTTIEATNRDWFEPSRLQGVTWSSPLTSRVLAEAGWGTYESRYRNPAPRIDGTFNPRMIRSQEQSAIYGIPNLTYRMPAGVGGGFNHHLIGTKANNRASLSYVTGAHNMKFGYQGGFNNPNQTYQYFNEVVFVRLNNGAPNQLTQVITTNDSPARIKVTRNLWPTSFYGQDQWTHDRLTLQGGVRYDYYLMNYPESRIGGPGYTASAQPEIVYPSRSTQQVKWHDITPRVGVAYDVFGDGKTAIKFNLGKYMQAIPATNSDLDLNPIIRTAISTTRTWTDSDKDFVVDCVLSNTEKNGECAAMNNKNLGKEVFDRTYDPNFVEGWGVRPYNWGLGISVQQEVAPRVSVNVGYFRNWWGNWYTVDNRGNQLSDWTSFGIKAPVDPRLPGGGGQVISGLYDLVPTAVGKVDELATNSKNFAKQTENWQGVDVGAVARLRNGLTVQGGTSTGRKLADSCELRAVLPEQGRGTRGATTSVTSASGSPVNPYCREVEPYQTSIRGLATYTIPRIDVQVSGTWRNDPGDSLAANYVANNAVIAAGPQPLGRNLSESTNVTVNLIEPYTFYSDRRNNIDLRIAKIFRYGRTRTQLGVDIYNLTNTDVVTGFNQTFSPTSTTWLTPTAIQPARYAKISVQFDF
jgi:Carboxypeptidase regulatory-like domain